MRKIETVAYGPKEILNLLKVLCDFARWFCPVVIHVGQNQISISVGPGLVQFVLVLLFYCPRLQRDNLHNCV